MSEYITENKSTIAQAVEQGLDAGAAQITIETNNGAIEVRNGNGAILMRAKNVKSGTLNAVWSVLEAAGDIDFRA